MELEFDIDEFYIGNIVTRKEEIIKNEYYIQSIEQHSYDGILYKPFYGLRLINPRPEYNPSIIKVTADKIEKSVRD